MFPLFKDAEQRWNNILRIVLYFLGLCYCFFGVAIVADIFMGAIERITSAKKRVYSAQHNRYITVTVWNATVANLTLMALGSSAPEILLSLIELFANKWHSSSLGPGTIVGSAAFNLFVISAVCVVSIPDDEVRYVRYVEVYIITSTCSIFAYLWLVVILKVWTPHIVDIAEGALTLVFFPILVSIAYLADKGYISCRRANSLEVQQAEGLKNWRLDQLPEDDFWKVAEVDRQLKKMGVHCEDEVARVIEHEHVNPMSKAHYTMVGVRNALGGNAKPILRLRESELETNVVKSPKKPVTLDTPFTIMELALSKNSLEGPINIDMKASRRTSISGQGQGSYVSFASTFVVASGSEGMLALTVMRTGDSSTLAVVRYRTSDGTAQAGEAYEGVDGELGFAPGENMACIMVKLKEGSEDLDGKIFYVDLLPIQSTGKVLSTTHPTTFGHKMPSVSSNYRVHAMLGQASQMRVQFGTETEPSEDMLMFADGEELRFPEADEDETKSLTILRRGKCKGTITVKCFTEDCSAVGTADFVPISCEVPMGPGQTLACVELRICARGRYESTEDFRVVLAEPSLGVIFDEKTDGGAESSILTVVIEADPDKKDRLDRLIAKVNWDRLNIGRSNWAGQFQEALFAGGSPEEQQEAEWLDLIMHWICLPWKLLFAFIPPTEFMHGKVCFVCSLAMIGGLTACIGDLAALLGCCLGIPDSTTAITLVALGTSLPDTFASRTAAKMDPYADMSIGNIMGSNSVNVFLGLGMPWLTAAIYWSVKGRTTDWDSRYPDKIKDCPNGCFVVQAGTLVPSVCVFSGLACCAIALLAVRRILYGGELGGPQRAKHVSAAILVGCWLTYCVFSIIMDVKDGKK